MISPQGMLRATLLAVSLAVAPCTVRADVVAQFDLTGKTGTETSDAATFVTTGVTSYDLVRGAGLTATAASNGFAASGWNDLQTTDYFKFGVNVVPGSTATITEIMIATRSSATGPGPVNLFYALTDGGPETLLTTFNQSGTTYIDTDLTLPTSITSTGSVLFILRAANSTSASGGTIGSAGTFRVTDFLDGAGTYHPITLFGTVGPTAIPEPSPVVFGGMASVALVMVLRFSRRPR